MNKLFLSLIILLLVSACSVKEPRVSFGKKCMEKDDKIVYSYVWIYDKNVGMTATETACELLKKN